MTFNVGFFKTIMIGFFLKTVALAGPFETCGKLCGRPSCNLLLFSATARPYVNFHFT